MAIYQRVSRKKGATRKRDSHQQFCRKKSDNRQRGSWYYTFQYRGTRYVGCIGRVSRSVAKEEEARKRAEVVEQRLNPVKAFKSPRFDEFGVTYLEWVRANRKPETCRRITRTVKNLTEFFNAKKLSEITSWHFEQYKKARKDVGLASSSINLEIAVLKSMLTKAVTWKKLAAHPGKDVKLLKAPQGKTRFLSEGEEAAILAVCSPALRRIVQVGLLTGFRRQELTSLRPVDIDLERNLVSVAACYAKNGESRTLPMSPRLKALLQEALTTGNASAVFRKDNGEAWTPNAFAAAFAVACRRAGLELLAHVTDLCFFRKFAVIFSRYARIDCMSRTFTSTRLASYVCFSPSHGGRRHSYSARPDGTQDYRDDFALRSSLPRSQAVSDGHVRSDVFPKKCYPEPQPTVLTPALSNAKVVALH